MTRDEAQSTPEVEVTKGQPDGGDVHVPTIVTRSKRRRKLREKLGGKCADCK